MRRYWLTLFTALVWLSGVAAAHAQPQKPETIPIIDVHTHTSFTGGNDPNTGRPNVEAYKRAIPKEHWKAVFHDNAVRVFKLRESP